MIKSKVFHTSTERFICDLKHWKDEEYILFICCENYLWGINDDDSDKSIKEMQGHHFFCNDEIGGDHNP